MMRTFIAGIVVAGLIGCIPAWGQAHSVAGLVSSELGVDSKVANRYLDSLGEAVASSVLKGQRVVIDGLGAFEPAFALDGDSDNVLHSLDFRFNLARPIEHPCFPTLFDDRLAGLIAAIDQSKSQEDALSASRAAQLLDVVVFATLFNTDQNQRAGLGNSFGDFSGGVELVAPAQDYNSSRSNKARGIAADFSDDIIEDAEDILIQRYAAGQLRNPRALRIVQANLAANRFIRAGLALVLEAHRNQNPDDNRPDRLVVVSDELLTEVGNDLIAAAQDHNASRSNKTSAVIISFVEDLVGEVQANAKAQDYNSSRSNKARGEFGGLVDDIDDAVEVEVLAQDYNSSRSNKARGIAADFSDDIIGDIEDAIFDAIQRAQDYNSSRSNKARGVAKSLFDDFRDDLLYALLTNRAQDYNSSRSNKARGVAADFVDDVIRLIWLSEISSTPAAAPGGQVRLQDSTIIETIEEVFAGAQDHNASRSNKTSAAINTLVDDLLDEVETVAKAQDYNSSRSNKARGIADLHLPTIYEAVAAEIVEAGYAVGGPNPTVAEFQAFVSEYFGKSPSAPAQDHNASRSNKTRTSPYYKELLETYGAAPAQDHNASRSNKTSAIVDFTPSDTLIKFLNSN